MIYKGKDYNRNHHFQQNSLSNYWISLKNDSATDCTVNSTELGKNQDCFLEFDLEKL